MEKSIIQISKEFIEKYETFLNSEKAKLQRNDGKGDFFGQEFNYIGMVIDKFKKAGLYDFDINERITNFSIFNDTINIAYTNVAVYRKKLYKWKNL